MEQLLISPDPDEPGLKIEDCKLNIYRCRFAPAFLNGKNSSNIQYSFDNIQSLETLPLNSDQPFFGL